MTRLLTVLLLLVLWHVDAIVIGRDGGKDTLSSEPVLTTLMTTASPSFSDPRLSLDDNLRRGVLNLIQNLTVPQLYQVVDEIFRRIDTLSGLEPADSYVLRARLQSNLRAKRSLQTVLASVSAFIVRTGILDVFKIACKGFLKSAGQILIGELTEHLRSRRSKRATSFEKVITVNDLFSGTIPCTCGMSDPSYVNIPVPPQSVLLQRGNHYFGFPGIPVRKLVKTYSQLKLFSEDSPMYSVSNQKLHVAAIVLGLYDLTPYLPQHFGVVFAGDTCLMNSMFCYIPISSRVRSRKPYFQGCGEFTAMDFEVSGFYFPIESLSALELCKNAQDMQYLYCDSHSKTLKNSRIESLYLHLSNGLGNYSSSLRYIEFNPMVWLDFSDYPDKW